MTNKKEGCLDEHLGMICRCLDSLDELRGSLDRCLGVDPANVTRGDMYRVRYLQTMIELLAADVRWTRTRS